MGDGVDFASERRRSDPEITRLTDRIRRPVAEQQRLEDSPESERRDANTRERDRRQRRLATAVNRGLSG